jgi:hypothetical protein
MPHNKKGYSLLEVVVGMQVLVLLLTFSGMAFRQITIQQRTVAETFRQVCVLQEKLEHYKHLAWSEIRSCSEEGVLVTDLDPSLKQVAVSTGNIILETMLFRGPS